VSICIVDTSVFCELLDVPMLNGQRQAGLKQLRRKELARENLLLPLPTIIETGNHIGQCANGVARRDAALRLVATVTRTIDGDLPFALCRAVDSAELREWLGEFPAWSQQRSGLADLWLKKEWDRQCRLHPMRRVYIWSFDRHLVAFDRVP